MEKSILYPHGVKAQLLSGHGIINELRGLG
jgi:uncharacterized protein YwbE